MMPRRRNERTYGLAWIEAERRLAKLGWLPNGVKNRAPSRIKVGDLPYAVPPSKKVFPPT